MDIGTYIQERLDPQIDWYNDRSGRNKRAFNALRTAELATAAAIPVLAPFLAADDFQKLAATLGGVVTVLAGLLAHYKPQEKWLHYRTTCEALRQHKLRFLTATHPYESQTLQNLVDRCEVLISSENTQWSSLVVGGDQGQPEEETESAPT